MTVRDPARIPRLIEALQAAWEKYPDLRLGQLVSNSRYFDADGINHGDPRTPVELVEDNVILEGLRGIASR